MPPRAYEKKIEKIFLYLKRKENLLEVSVQASGGIPLLLHP